MAVLRATLDQLDLLVPLFDGYRCFYKQESDLEGAREFLKKRLEREEAVVFLDLPEDDATIPHGFVLLYPHFSSVSIQHTWILNDLFVAPEARRMGVANRLMATAEAFAIENRAKGLQLETDKLNRKAKALYTSRGWVMDQELDHYSFLVSG